MTPADFTNDLLISWGGAEVFNQALNLVQHQNVLRAEWDDVEHIIRGELTGPTGYPMKTSLSVLDDGTPILRSVFAILWEFRTSSAGMPG